VTHISGFERSQILLLPEAVDDYVGADNPVENISKGRHLEVAAIYERYEQAKADHQAVDFGDIIMRPTLLMESNPARRTIAPPACAR
jgi:DNA helicase-2/ATP-dependent DNA helicase PcrA